MKGMYFDIAGTSYAVSIVVLRTETAAVNIKPCG